MELRLGNPRGHACTRGWFLSLYLFAEELVCVIGLLGTFSLYQPSPVVNLFCIKNLVYDRYSAVKVLNPLLNAVLRQLLCLQVGQSSKRKARIAASAGP